jgi:SAM-dependent methyltransferase
MSIIRNILNLPFAIIFFFISLIALMVNLVIPKKKFIEIQRRAQQNEISERLKSIAGLIKSGDKVLDVGCGNGHFGKAVADHFGSTVSGVDVVDYQNAEIPVKLYDGHKIPHLDGAFEVIILAFMLHHVGHQEELLAEAIRCSRGKVIIFEDVYFSPWQWAFVMWNDFYTNILFGAVRVLKGEVGKGLLSIPMPLTFRSVKGWQVLFQNYPVTLERAAVRHARHKPHSKCVFCLEVKP